jgi:hypothetical protein
MKEDERGKACGKYEEKRETYSVLVGKLEGKRPFVRPRRRWKNNTKIDLQELISGDLTVMNMARIGTSGWLF